MIRYSENEIWTQWDGKQRTIRRWEVAFETPIGTFESLSAANAACLRNDMDPDTCIIPRPVAICDDEYYEIVR